MVTACLIATMNKFHTFEDDGTSTPEEAEPYDSIDGPSEEEAYLQGPYLHRLIMSIGPSSCFYAGEYKTILHLVGVLTHGKMAKRLTDRAIDLMQDVQNLRKAIYEFVSLVTYLFVQPLTHSLT